MGKRKKKRILETIGRTRKELLDLVAEAHSQSGNGRSRRTAGKAQSPEARDLPAALE